MADMEDDQVLRDIQREYLDFLDDEEDDGTYNTKVKAMIEDEKIRIVVNVNDLRAKNPTRANQLLTNAFEEQTAFHKALHEYVRTVDPNYASRHEEFFISFEGSFGSGHITPRTLNSRYLGRIVCVEGIVTKCSMVYPKIVKSIHYCPATGVTKAVRYTDMTSFSAFPSSSVYPTKDDDGNVLETEYGKCSYKDHQTMTIQEMPEKAPAGQLPRNVDIILDNDLADSCKAGDRVQVVGSYRCLPNKKGGFTSGAFRTILIANNVIQLTSVADGVHLTTEDVKNCRKLSKRKNLFELLSRSLAPSIQGHEYTKMAILCMLLGGNEKILANGTRLRGDINLLLIGDPSVAKSQLLRYVLCTAPRAIATTGRGSSGVGLTAAVTTDMETGERRLEAGAMVLADRGVVCIDEFDKMSDIDRTAIHEVMEQGRVTISKAGIHARLNARCSVLAAANPVYGRYDQFRTPMENIGLQDSLLSRFDLIFVMLDVIDKANDEKIADHVVRMHKYRKPGEQEGEVLKSAAVDILSTTTTDEAMGDGQTSALFEKYDSLLHGPLKSKKIFTVQFMRKYIHLCKQFTPVLGDDAAKMIAEEYAKLRSEDEKEADVARTQPVTVRTLETLIRLSTAHAKARLSRTIDVVDAAVAISLVEYAIFKKVKPKLKKRKTTEGDHTEDEDTEFEDDHDEASENRPRKRARVGTDVYEYYEDSSMDVPSGTNLDSQRIDLTVQASSSSGTDAPAEEPSTAVELPPPTEISKERFEFFKKCIRTMFDESSGEPLNLSQVTDRINQKRPASENAFEGGEISAAIFKMSDSNEIMLVDQKLFLV